MSASVLRPPRGAGLSPFVGAGRLGERRQIEREAWPRRVCGADGAREFRLEPPLEFGRPGNAEAARLSFNARWLGACVLSGLAGIALLGSAIYVSSEGEVTFAEPAEQMPASPARNDGGGLLAARKADKLVRTDTIAAAKQTFRAPMTLRNGDREVIKMRSFVRLAANLSLTSGIYATNIPPFNPMRFFSDPGVERVADVAPETSDAEVSVVKSDLSTLSVDPNAPTLNDEAVAAQLAEETRLAAEAGRRATIAPPASMMLSRMLGARDRTEPAGAPGLFPRAIDAPFRSLDIRVVPENVTNQAKTPARAPELSFEERSVPLPRGDALEAALRGNGANPDETRAIGSALGGRDRIASDSLQLRLLLAPAARPGEPRQIARASLVSERGIEAIAALNDRGSYVSVTPPPIESRGSVERTAPQGADDDSEDEGTGVPLYDSLYETALKHEIPRQTVEDLIRIFGYDVDFQRRVGVGDSVELFCAGDDEGGSDRLDVLTATLTIGQDVHRVYRYQADDGSVDYFDEAGRSLKKFLIRKPVAEARMSSGFGSRYHPILGYAKMHTGVDWAAKSGTPILAAGNGTIIKADWDSGYGRRTEIQHANGYVTTYNHQSGFARGIVPGAKVRQGQVIGFVGTTGLSTGAHVHFEVLINGHFVDPMKIRVPRGRELDGRALADFGRQRDQIDQIMDKSGSRNRLAQRETR